MKFGGSSVGDTERMKRVAKRITEKKAEGNQVIVVVSAMGDTTDDLIDLANELTGASFRAGNGYVAYDGGAMSVALLSMAVQQLGFQQCPSRVGRLVC